MEKGITMNTSELVDKLAAEQGLTKVVAKAVVEATFKAIADAAAVGNECNFPGFGKFKISSRAAREGRNPATGATIQIAASKSLGFSPAKALKDRLNG
jgi:DNA-binding protein HU-beta